MCCGLCIVLFIKFRPSGGGDEIVVEETGGYEPEHVIVVEEEHPYDHEPEHVIVEHHDGY